MTGYEEYPTFDQAREAGRITRRRFLTATGAAAALALTPGALGPLPGSYGSVRHTNRSADYPFTLGVASGDPLPNAVVIWTRLVSDPLTPGGDMPDAPVKVEWQVATDEAFTLVVKSGSVSATPARALSVHIDVTGLEPARDYYYRFRALGEISPTGRTRTAPDPGSSLSALMFAFASCQSWTAGFYTAYQDIAARAHDLVVHVGDYIYEYGLRPELARGGTIPDEYRHDTRSLAQYRDRYAIHKADPDLQAAHHAAPWVATIDDHEVVNNWTGGLLPGEEPDDELLVRRAHAFRAHFEHMPLRPPQRPSGPDMQLFRRFTYADLATFHVLDTRQYRNRQVDTGSQERSNPQRHSLGRRQEGWLLAGLTRQRTRWEIAAHQTAIARLARRATPETPPEDQDEQGRTMPTDTWDNYPVARERLLQRVADRDVSNLVFIAGDLHRSVASEIMLNFDDPQSPTVGVEYIGTSVSSGGNGADPDPTFPELAEVNPHVRWGNRQRGYVSCTVTPERFEAEYRVTSEVEKPGGTTSTKARLVTPDGEPVVHIA